MHHLRINPGVRPHVFGEDPKIVQRMAPHLRRTLIVDPHAAVARILSDLMRTIAGSQVVMASTSARGFELARTWEPSVIFAEMSGVGVDGIEFTRRLRRSDMSSRQAPVIMVTASATAAGILKARDAGVHEFLRKPFTSKDLLRRLEAVTLRPRDWIEAVHYVGPDRRRFNSGDYSGSLKRRADGRAAPDTSRIIQALRILRSAVAAIETDPVQALRSIHAQTAELQRAAVAVGDMKLSTATADFQRWFSAAQQKGVLTRGELEPHAAPLIAFLPRDTTHEVEIAA